MSGRSPLRGSGLRPDGLSQSALSQAEPLVPNAVFAIHPKLQRAFVKYQKARDLWHAAIRETQAVCNHEVWACEDGHSGMLFNHPSIQICVSCRAEVQTGTYDGWSAYVWRHPKFVRLTITPQQAGIANGNICAMRLRDDPRGFQTAHDIASAMSASGQDPEEGLEAKPASAVGEAETPNA